MFRKDPTAFRLRFNEYKNGKMPYKNGLPAYSEGTPSIVDMLDDELLDTLHYINDYFSNLGMSTVDIAGIAANMFKESSFRHNAKNGAGYHGYVQMSPDMLLAVKTAYGNLDPDTQLLFVYDQLTGNSKVKGYTNGVGYLYGLYKTGGDAAEAFRSTFERNKAGRQQSRIDYGNLIYDYLANRAVENAIKKEIGELPMPIIARPDATSVKKIVPKAKTRARWTGADTVSPYITGKPIIKLLKKTNLPNIIEENKKALWKAPMGFKNGKLPKFYMGTDGDVDMGERALLTNEDIISSVVKMPHEEGLKNGPIEDAIIGYYFGGKPFTLYNAYNNYRYIKNAKRMYKTAREANDNTRNWNNTGPASRRWKMQDADEYARKWAYSDDPLGFLYDVFVTPLSNVYRSAQRHPKIGPVLNLFE